MKQFTLIYYVVPQDNDDVEIPNAFGIGKTIDQVTLKDIKSNFPLQGEYIFRFRYKTTHNTVWLDLPNDQSQIPQYNNRILVKATRISWDSQTPIQNTQIPQQRQQQQQQQQQPLQQSPSSQQTQQLQQQLNLIEF